ncbi:MAG: hypothetical protein ABI823_16420 [Bryobacteraceae bacterium]
MKLCVATMLLCAGYAAGGQAEYVGGTVSALSQGHGGSVEATDQKFFVFYSKKASVRIPYEQINLVEYGQKVDRRYLSAALISPLLILAKKRTHFLTVGYKDEEGHQQAMVFRIEKSAIRSLLVSLEARTGLKIQFQDEEARKAGKG